jgi:hypothetical protein
MDGWMLTDLPRVLCARMGWEVWLGGDVCASPALVTDDYRCVSSCAWLGIVGPWEEAESGHLTRSGITLSQRRQEFASCLRRMW